MHQMHLIFNHFLTKSLYIEMLTWLVLIVYGNVLCHASLDQFENWGEVDLAYFEEIGVNANAISDFQCVAYCKSQGKDACNTVKMVEQKCNLYFLSNNEIKSLSGKPNAVGGYGNVWINSPHRPTKITGL